MIAERKSLHAIMPWENHSLPLKLTETRAHHLKQVIRFILKMKYASVAQAYNFATVADGFYYILKKHQMPGLFVKGPYVNDGHRVVQLKHFTVASRD